MRRYHETFRLWEYLLFAVVTLAVLCLCVCIGSVRVPLGDTLAFFAAKLTGGALPEGLVSSIMPIRLPRVLCVALTGAALSLAGAAMQGLLKNPLADGSTLGVSSGASLGAVCAIAFGVTLTVNEIELQLYRYHGVQTALAQLLPQAVKNVPRLNVKGSAIFIDHGQEHLTDKLWIGGRRS